MALAVVQCLELCAVAVQIVGVHSLFPLVRRATVFAVGEPQADWEDSWRETITPTSGAGGPAPKPAQW
jgi:hypothetical protein